MGNGASNFCAHIATKDQHSVVKKVESPESTEPAPSKEPEVEGDVQKIDGTRERPMDVTTADDIAVEQTPDRQTPSSLSSVMEDLGESNENAYDEELQINPSEENSPVPCGTIRRVNTYRESDEFNSESTPSVSELCAGNNIYLNDKDEAVACGPESSLWVRRSSRADSQVQHSESSGDSTNSVAPNQKPVNLSEDPPGDESNHLNLQTEERQTPLDLDNRGLPNLPTKLPVVTTAVVLVGSTLSVRAPGLRAHEIQRDAATTDKISYPFYPRDDLSAHTMVEDYTEKFSDMRDASVAAVEEKADASTSMYVCVEGDNVSAIDLMVHTVERTISEDSKAHPSRYMRSMSLVVQENNKIAAAHSEDATDLSITHSNQRSHSTGNIRVERASTTGSITTTPTVMLGNFVRLTEEDESSNVSESTPNSATVDFLARKYSEISTVSTVTARKDSVHTEVDSLLGGPYAIDLDREGHIHTPSLDEHLQQRGFAKSVSLNIISGDMQSLPPLSLEKRLSEGNHVTGENNLTDMARKKRRDTDMGSDRHGKSLNLSHMLQKIGSQTCCARAQTEIIPIDGPTFFRVLQSDDEFQILDEDRKETADSEERQNVAESREHAEFFRSQVISSLMGDCHNNSSQPHAELGLALYADGIERPPKPIHLGTMDKLLPRSVLYERRRTSEQ